MDHAQRQSATRQSPQAAAASSVPAPGLGNDLFARAIQHHERGELSTAADLYEKVLALQSAHVAACERLALVYLAEGKLDKASIRYAELARLMPQTLGSFAKVVETLKNLIPDLMPAFVNYNTASLENLTARNSAARGGTSIAGNCYFRIVLDSTVVRDAALERWLTVLRAAILRAALADEPPENDDLLAFSASLAQQCFINEYVFAVTADEMELVERLKTMVTDAVSRAAPIHPLQPLALAMYVALHKLPDAPLLAERSWPAPLDAVVTQQVREPIEEERLRASMPRLTAIGGGVTAQVREQYEQNPYPRWVRLGAPPGTLRVLDDYIRRQFPAAQFRPVGRRDSLDILEAGCGTGRHALEVAQAYRGARVLAVDLSLASLASAKRKIPQALADRIEFAQADILSLGSIGRSFDLINTGGVLHHMGDPLAGWRELLKLLKPNGLMKVGLYSAHARWEINAARKLIAERGYRSTPEDIRRCRQDLFNGPEQFKFMAMSDFFSVSDCRDLLFHVHERQFTIPEIKDFLAGNDLKFIGFDFNPQAAHLHYRSVFAKAGWSTGDLDRWDAYERANPDIFANMYAFWIQKH